MFSGCQLERKRSQSLGLVWPDRKSIVRAKAKALAHSGPGGFPKARRGRQIVDSQIAAVQPRNLPRPPSWIRITKQRLKLFLLKGNLATLRQRY